jgi:integrase
MAKDLTSVTLTALVRRTPSARLETPDGKIRGLYFIQQPTGAASWAFRYRLNGEPKKLTLGPYPNIDLKTARDLATEASVTLAKGGDPSADKKQARAAAKKVRDAARSPADRELIENVVTSFIARYAQKNTRESSWRETERILVKEVVSRWKGRRLESITRTEVIELLDEIVDRAPIMANRLLAALRRMCSWAVERDIIKVSPCEKIKAPAPEKSRDRVLEDDELASVWRAADDLGWPFGPIVQMLILTGQRREEVAAMTWAELDLPGKLWTLPRGRVKNDKGHLVPLSPQAIEILETLPHVAGKENFVFSTTGETSVSGFARAKSRLDKLLDPDMPGFTLHDLRRTAASGMARLGFAPQVVEAVLNHKTGTIRGVAAVYNRYDHAAEKRAALEAWGRHVEGLINGKTSANVIPLREARI